ncbi:MAG: hypothetical protein HY532_00205 [Chloroflexi bacterium]|nr:hypothetical protein [Chloroflexota bacterium]
MKAWGKGNEGWFVVNLVSVSFDHPYHAPLENAVSLDFTHSAKGMDTRVAVELTADSAKELVKAIQAALARGEAEGLQS